MYWRWKNNQLYFCLLYRCKLYLSRGQEKIQLCGRTICRSFPLTPYFWSPLHFIQMLKLQQPFRIKMAVLQQFPQGAVEIRGDFFLLPSEQGVVLSESMGDFFLSPQAEPFQIKLKLKCAIFYILLLGRFSPWGSWQLQGDIHFRSSPPSFLSTVANATIAAILGGYWSLNKLYVWQ